MEQELRLKLEAAERAFEAQAEKDRTLMRLDELREPHLAALGRILRYVHGTIDYGLQLYSSSTSSLIAYSDVDWAGCSATRRSTSGYYVFLGTNLLSWSSKRQYTLSRSSAEAEYCGVTNACDLFILDPVKHQRTKRIEINIHFVRDQVIVRQVYGLHIPSLISTPHDWLKFNNRNFSLDSRKEFCNNHKGLLSKEIEGLEALDYVEFNTLQEGRAFLTLEQFCHVSFRHNDRNFTSQAWNRLFGIREQVVRVYVLELLSSFKFRDHVVELDINDTMVFQLLGTRRSMSMRTRRVVDDQLDNSGDEAKVTKVRRAQDEAGGVRHHPNMSFNNTIWAMDDRLGDMDTNIYKLSNDVENLTYVVSRMCEQYDQFYREFGQMRMEQERFCNWNTDHLSQLLAYHHIDHTRYDGTQCSYVTNIPDL
uniref:Ribonuclease H-like domain-containing protein n=1 Tax=Tanacetum cinerariifolium TaxID=118510 RepID=A0A6L2LRC1_TANCI|nr:ribonuclease H-like domain-containing protein [Tanacetum cinerariifolium]